MLANHSKLWTTAAIGSGMCFAGRKGAGKTHTRADLAKTGENSDRKRRPLSLPNWKEAFLGSSLASAVTARYRREILAFLHHCKIHHAGASIILTKAYLTVAETQGRSRGIPDLSLAGPLH
ncbi:MAG: hypothetical protein IPL39_20920 [Opitutaceae bacterium]|nr:hypothetical protein [Opitutaceae bacterium]